MRATTYLLLVLTTVFWAGNHVVARAIHADIPPTALTFWRWTIAGAVFWFLASADLSRAWPVVRRHWRLLFVLSATVIVGFNLTLYIALNTTTAVNSALMNAVIPVVIPLVAFAIDREGVTGRQSMGIALSVCGAVIIISRADAHVLLELRFTPGDIWLVGSVVAWALYTVLLKRLPDDLPPMVVLAVVTAMGLVILLPFYALELATVGGFAVTWETAGSIAYVSIVVSVLGFLFWNRGVADIGPTKSGLFLNLIPIFTVVLAAVFLNEALELFHLAGAVLIFAGVYMTTSARSQAPAPGN